MTIIIAGKKLTLDEALRVVSEPYVQSKKSKKAWDEYVNKTKSKKCKEGNCHTEDDSYEDGKDSKILCVVCGRSIGDEYWSCYCCRKDFCEDHMKNHEELNGRVFDYD